MDHIILLMIDDLISSQLLYQFLEKMDFKMYIQIYYLMIDSKIIYFAQLIASMLQMKNFQKLKLL